MDAVCAGSFEHLDRRVGHLRALFDVDGGIVDYSFVPGERLDEFCDSTLGCAQLGHAFSKDAVDEHELFHALRGAWSHRGLEEGLAVAYGDDRELPGAVQGDVGTVLTEAGEFDLPSTGTYPLLGHFVSYLRAEYGQGAISSLDRRSSITEGFDDLTRDLESVTETSATDLLEDYAARYPACDSRRYRYDGFECGAEPIQLPRLEDDDLVMDVEVGCNDPATVGPRRGEIWTTRALSVPIDGRHVISVYSTSTTPGELRISECGASCFDADDVYYVDANAVMGLNPCLRAGTYVLRLSVQYGEAATFQVEVHRSDEGTCDE